VANKVLVVVDMQVDFITGALGSKAAQSIVPDVVKKIEEWGGHIVYTMDTHWSNYASTLEGKKLPIPHCVHGTDGWKLHPSIAEAFQNKFVRELEEVRKRTFGSIVLADKLKTLLCEESGLDWDEFELCGLCTDICVVSNALILRASFPNVPITVNSRLCAGTTPEAHEAALATMRSCQIDVIQE
jgi:nicotinamidase-related amidase